MPFNYARVCQQAGEEESMSEAGASGITRDKAHSGRDAVPDAVHIYLTSAKQYTWLNED